MTLQPRNASGGSQQLNLYSLRHLELLLGMKRQELRAVASRAGRYYAPFPKSTPEFPFPKKLSPKKIRLIDNPLEPLKSLQDKIYRKVLTRIVLPEHLLGGMPGKTIKHNVLMHIGAEVLIKIDIKGFFPSITAAMVYQAWREILDCSPDIANLLTKLTTRNNHLPQGAATSTLLANVVLASFDSPIRAACQSRSIRYSSWVDDLAFSGAGAVREVAAVAISTLNRAGFSVKHKKIKLMGKGCQKVLNNILLSKTPSLERAKLDQLRSGIHKLKVGQVSPSELDQYSRQLRGRIGFAKFINPKKGAALELNLESALGKPKKTG
jgi:hypothetical protein